MGIAALWIMLFHLIDFPVLNWGYSGVDIFLFLSGWGLFYSWQKNPDAYSFYVKRLWRIFPAYAIVVTGGYLIKWFFLHEPVDYLDYLSALTTVKYWYGYLIHWYIALIVLLYLLFPFYIRIFRTNLWGGVFFTLLIAVCDSLFFQYNTMAIVRIPIFCIGVVFGSMAYKGDSLPGYTLALLRILMVVGFLVTALLVEFYWNNSPILKWDVGLFWYPFIVITPGFCIFYAEFMNKYKQISFWNYSDRFWAYLGVFSLELYLIHVGFNYSFPKGIPYRALIIILLSLISAKLLQLGIEKVRNLVTPIENSHLRL